MATRFLLSHNYSIAESVAPPLSAAEFCEVFAKGQPDWTVRSLSHPHWRCEVLAEADPAQVGEALAKTLRDYRSQQRSRPYTILALGGRKTTPAAGSGGLQPGDWGVDVVEALDADEFLQTIGWQSLTADRSAADMFKTVLS
ncbi:MAG: DUF2656 domain-containing protein [Leptolyngbya sp. SIO4C1]|nr:DUF2656 domain-containing protein [Leptolyngbya sp. SIO4C1]